MPRALRSVAAALALAILAGAASARPFTVDDLLGQESFGDLAIDPSGRWLVFEQRGAYDSAPRFDSHFATGQTLGRLNVVDLASHARARPLLAEDAGPGLLIGPFSPSGRHLAVFRYQDHAWTLGVVTLATGAVRWFAITPAEVRRGRALQWASDQALYVLDRPDGLPPADKRQDWLVRARLNAAWAAAASGAGAHTVLGSGAYADLRARAADRRLLKVDLERDTVETLATGPFIDMELSPDGLRLALFRSGRDLQARGDEPVRGPAGLETEATELEVLELKTRTSWRPCPACDFLPNLLAWAPHGQALLVFDRGARRVWTSGEFVRVDVSDRRLTTIGRNLEPRATLNPVSFRAGWMGPEPVAYARPRNGGRYDWYRLDAHAPVKLSGGLPGGEQQILASDAGGLAVLVGHRVYRIDRRGEGREVGGPAVSPALRAFPGTAGSRLINSLPAGTWLLRSTDQALLWQDTRRAIAATSRGDPLGVLAAVARTTKTAVIRTRDDHGVETLTVQTGDEPPRTMASINAGLADADVPQVLPIHHRDRAGQALTSWLYLPSYAAGQRPPPLVVRPYLGYNHPTPPRELYMEQGFFQNIRMLTAHGYAVLVPSLPVPPGGMTDPMADVGDRILAVVDAAATDPALAGRFDASRLGVLGWSFGGYTTMAALTQTTRFRAAVAMDGISDLIDYWSTLSLSRLIVPEDGYGTMGVTGAVESTQPALGVPPWRDLARYTRNSPLLSADKIETPLLLIHGGLDPVPMSGSVAMYSALFRQRKDAVLAIYWGANHAATAPGDVRDIWARTFAFLDEHLMPNGGDVPPSASPEPGSASAAPRPPRPPH